MEEERKLEKVKEEILNYWDGEGGTYHQDTLGFGAREEKEWQSFFNKEFSKGDKILDLGTGAGTLSLLMAEMEYDVIGLDISENMLNEARRRANIKGLKVDLRKGDAEDPPFDDETFDIITFRWLLWTLPSPRKALREWKRILRPEGRIYAFEPEMKKVNSVKRFIGNLGILIIDRRNPWTSDWDYSEEVKKKLPVYPELKIDKMSRLFDEEGFKHVSVEQMENIDQAGKRETPFRYKLAWDCSTYCIQAIKPLEVRT